jgi:hypothetical protein
MGALARAAAGALRRRAAASARAKSGAAVAGDALTLRSLRLGGLNVNLGQWRTAAAAATATANNGGGRRWDSSRVSASTRWSSGTSSVAARGYAADAAGGTGGNGGTGTPLAPASPIDNSPSTSSADQAAVAAQGAGPRELPPLDAAAPNSRKDLYMMFTCGQGLTLVHFSAQRKRILWDTLGA